MAESSVTPVEVAERAYLMGMIHAALLQAPFEVAINQIDAESGVMRASTPRATFRIYLHIE